MPRIFTTLQHIVVSTMLIVAMAACGDVELPPKPPTPAPDAPSPTPDTPSTEGDAPSTTPDTPSTEGNTSIDIGRVSFTSDGHILIDGRLYLSREEYVDVPGCNNAASPDKAARLAAAYVEGELTGWRVPTIDDVRLLRECLECESPYYGPEPLPQLNKVLDAHDLPQIFNNRYLCDDAAHTFNFLLDSQIATSSKTALYFLRLVSDK